MEKIVTTEEREPTRKIIRLPAVPGEIKIPIDVKKAELVDKLLGIEPTVSAETSEEPKQKRSRTAGRSIYKSCYDCGECAQCEATSR